MSVRHYSWPFAPAWTTSGGLLRRLLVRLLVVGTLLSLAPAILPVGRARASAPAVRWVTTWAPSPVPAGTGDPYLAPSMPTNQAHNQSVRMIVRTTSPGALIRIHLTNRFGSPPVSV